MGAGQSTSKDYSNIKEGFHVLAMDTDSPCVNAGIEVFFDFLVMIDGEICRANNEISNYLNGCTRDEVNLTVYNHVKNKWREVIIPLIKRDGNAFLGVMVVRRNFEEAANHVWHVIEVAPNSPAAKAGIQPESEYILGAFKNDQFVDTTDVFSLFEKSIEEQLKLIIYNVYTHSARICEITPSTSWSSSSLVGLNLGHGILHRIPESVNTSNALKPNNYKTNKYQYGGLISKAISEKELNIMITNEKLNNGNNL